MQAVFQVNFATAVKRFLLFQAPALALARRARNSGNGANSSETIETKPAVPETRLKQGRPRLRPGNADRNRR